MRSSILYTKLRPSILFHCTSLNGPRRWFHLLSCSTSPLGRSLHWLRGNWTITLLPLSGPLRTAMNRDVYEHFNTVGTPHIKYPSLCMLYTLLLLNSKHAESKQGKLFFFKKKTFSLWIFCLSSPISLLFCCRSTACSHLKQMRETFDKKNQTLTNGGFL